MEHNKLVRDKIPEILTEQGLTFTTHTADNHEYASRLGNKLHEEVDELLQPKSNITEEMADVLEVLDALATHHGLDMKVVLKIKADKKAKRGGFTKRIILERTKDAS